MSTENQLNDINTRRICPSGPLSTSNPTWKGMLLNAGFRGEGMVTNCQNPNVKLYLKLADVNILAHFCIRLQCEIS